MTLPLLPPPQLLHPKYRPDIDGLRALAVLSVVAFHAFPGLAAYGLSGGFIGVDVFFVISGFLISTIIFENLDKGTFSFTEFYSRRITRIFPALLLVLIASYAFGWFALLADEYKQLGMHIAAGAGFFSNFALWNEAGYFDNSSETKPLLHLWSLGIEEQFYIIWPLLLWVAWKKKFNLLIITILVLAISFYLNVKGIKKDAVATFYSPQTRFWELLCGSVLAWVTLYKKDSFSTFRTKLDGYLASIVYREKPVVDGNALSNVISFLGMSLLMYGFWKITKEARFPGTKALLPVLGTVLIIAAGPTAWVNRTILSNKIAVWFGLISFPLYLWHWPLLSFARIVESEVPSRNIRIAAVLISIVLAWLTYKLVERPIRFGKQSRIKTATLVLLMFVVGGVGYTTYKKDGLSSREFISTNERIKNTFSNRNGSRDWFPCTKHIPEFKDIAFETCILTKDELPTIMFVGDSHTDHFKTAINDKFSSRSVLTVVKTSCLPFSTNSHFSNTECKKAYNAVIDFLDKNSTVKTVVLSGYWSYLMSGGFEKSGKLWRLASSLTEEGVSTFKSNGIDFVSRALKNDREVIFLKDIPDLGFTIQTCFDIRPIRITPLVSVRQDCSINFEEFIKRLSPYDAVINEFLPLFPTVKIYDPRPLFCQGGKCVGTNGFLPYYNDGDHLNDIGASIVIDDLVREFDTLK